MSNHSNKNADHNTDNQSINLIKPLRIGIVAGEASGDALGAELMQSLQQLHPRIEWVGVGGVQMQSMGMDSLFNMERLSVMGLVEVLKHLPDLLKAKQELTTFLLAEKIDLYIGIDAPDFNLRIAKVLKRKQIHTVQYVSPSVWAWRENRIHNIIASTDQVLCLFPFELPVYKKHQHPAVCVGHPLVHTIKPAINIAERRIKMVWELAQLKEKFADKKITSVVGILPGSRASEIERMAPVLLSAAQLVLEQNPEVIFLLPVLTFQQQLTLKVLLKQYPQALQEAMIVLQDTASQDLSQQVMSICDVLMLASGTVTLEAMLLERPMVVAYKLNPVSYELAKRLIKTPFVTLPNIIAGAEIVPELVQDQATPENIAHHTLDLLQDSTMQRHALQDTNYKLLHHDIEPAALAILSGYF